MYDCTLSKPYFKTHSELENVQSNWTKAMHSNDYIIIRYKISLYFVELNIERASFDWILLD